MRLLVECVRLCCVETFFCCLWVTANYINCLLLFSYPLDVVRARMAAQVDVRRYRNMLHGMQSMIRDEGTRALAKGLV